MPELLEQLRLPERNTRQHVRRRLQTAPPTDVFPELTRWVAGLDVEDPLHDRLMLEVLWIHQAQGRIDLEVLAETMALFEPRARAGAVRVLRYWLQQEVVDADAALPFLEQAVHDHNPLVRLEGVVACGFIPSVAGGSVAAIAGEYEMDGGLRNALEVTLEHLSRYGEPDSAIARRLRLERTEVDELRGLPMDDLVAAVLLVRPDVPVPSRREALTFLAGDDGSDQVRRLLQEVSAGAEAEADVATIAPLLLERESADLAGAEAALVDAAGSEHPPVAALAAAALQKVRPGEAVVHEHDPALAAAVLSYLESGEAPAVTVTRLRTAVENGVVDPNLAIEQIARHTGDEAGLAAWLAGLVNTVDRRSFDRFNYRHGIGMAALRAMNRIPQPKWPAGVDRYRIEPADAALLESGRVIYHDQINGCVRCHGKDGRGEEGFPPLDRSPWVLGDPQRAAAVVIHGLHGQLRMHDGRTFNSVMAPLGDNLTDQEIAAVLTYVRQNWGNYASPVDAAQVAAARLANPQDGASLDVQTLIGLFPLTRDRLVPMATVVSTPTRSVVDRRAFIVATGLAIAVAVVVIIVVGRVMGRNRPPVRPRTPVARRSSR